MVVGGRICFCVPWCFFCVLLEYSAFVFVILFVCLGGVRRARSLCFVGVVRSSTLHSTVLLSHSFLVRVRVRVALATRTDNLSLFVVCARARASESAKGTDFGSVQPILELLVETLRSFRPGSSD